MANPPDAADRAETVVLVIDRGQGREDRVMDATYNGAAFVNVRGFERGSDGATMFPMPRRGFSIRLRDLPAVIGALQKIADAHGVTAAAAAPASDAPPEWLAAWQPRQERRGR